MSRHDRNLPSADIAAPVALAPANEAPNVTPQKSKNLRKRTILGLLAIAVIAGAGYGIKDYLTTGRWMVKTNDAYVAADVMTISSRVQGYVASVKVQANQHVAAGDILVQLDDGDYRIAQQTAESRVETAGQTLARIDAQIAAARAGFAQAQAGRDGAMVQLHSAQTNANRVRSLAASNIAAQAQLDDAEDQLAAARARFASADAAVASAAAQVDVLIAQRAEATGTRHELELAVAQAQRNLDLTVLRAPSAGVVAKFTLETGDLVAPGTRLAALVPDRGLYIEANYKETQLDRIPTGATVHVTFDALPGQTFEGTVASIAPATGSVFSLLPPDNATGNFTKVVQRVPVRIVLPESLEDSGLLRAGLSAVVSVDQRTGEKPKQLAQPGN